MDYVPPPDLEGQYVFVKEAKSHFFWRGFWGAFAPTFSRRDLNHMEDQAEPRGEECMRGLKENGICELKGLKAVNGDSVNMRMDRGCAIAERTGTISGTATFPVPDKIGKLLPAPANPAKPLDCSKPGVTHSSKNADAASVMWLLEQGRLPLARAWGVASGQPYSLQQAYAAPVKITMQFG